MPKGRPEGSTSDFNKSTRIRLDIASMTTPPVRGQKAQMAKDYGVSTGLIYTLVKEKFGKRTVNRSYGDHL